MIRILSDSSTLYSIEEGKKNNVDISPLSVTINGKTYVENEEINTEEFIELIGQGHVPVSSQPAVGDVVNLYNKYPNDDIINISMGDGLSGTYNSACVAKEMCEHSDRIEVINSKTLCTPQRYLVNVAVKLAEIGKTKEEIIDEVNKLIKTSKSFLIPKDFEYLVRGGRLSPLMGRIAGAIKLVPVVTLSEEGNMLEKFTTKRTFRKAIEKISEELIKNGIDKNHKIYISHACIDELAFLAKDIILESIEDADIEIYKLGPVFTTQGGPGCVTIQTIKKHEALCN